MIQKSKYIATIFMMVVFFSGMTKAQNWSSEQKDVWAGVEKYWEVSSSGNAKAFMEYFDESYMGWSFQLKAPQNKANTSKWIENDFKNNSTVMHTLTPVTIWVKGDFAYVNYFYAQIEKNKETGKDETSSGSWTDILMKNNGKWVLVGDRGGRTSKQE